MAGPTRALGNMPAEATSFIGRRRELAELGAKLSSARMVSLVGPGGVGKTRLALRAGTDLARRFAAGAWLVELAELQDPALVSNAVMAALDLRDQAVTEPRALVLAHLKDKRLLLVLDNCEHLLEEAAALVTEVIRAAPGVRVLATSREPLSVSGEHVIAVAPLELPSGDAAESLARVRHNEAVLLFTERAAAASGSFQLLESNRAAVVDICRGLDGLPLAIELAAVRTRVLGAGQILDRLNDRFALLTGGGRAALPRHQTLRTTIDWSYDLLGAGEQALLRRLCVFAGRFTLEDVEGVCTSSESPSKQALDLLSSLVDKSLVMKEDVRGRARYRLHETMREYAVLRLRQVGEEDVFNWRCDDYYVARCLQSGEQARFHLPEWLEWVDLEIDNIRLVLRRCLVRADFTRGAGLALSLTWYWVTRATTEGTRWLDELLGSGGANRGIYGWISFIRGFLGVLQADPAAARPALEQAIAAARATEQLNLLSQSLSMAAIAENIAGDRAAAKRLLDESRDATKGVDDVPATVGLLQARAFDGLCAGDLDEVRSAASEGVRLSRATGDLYALGMMTMNLGFAALIAGDLDESTVLMKDALGIARQIDDRVGQLYQLGALACCAAGSGDARLAAQRFGATEKLRAAVGGGVNAILAPLMAQASSSVMATLGPTKFEAELNAGKRLSREAAVGLALGEPPRVAVDASQLVGPSQLGRREEELARLVAEGLSNKQIGSRLFISERTVEGHVRGILNKLGFSSRAQIAGWIASSNRQGEVR